MELGNWLAWQIDYLLVIQNFRDLSHHVFDNFFLFITNFSNDAVVISIVCLIYWAFNKKAGQFLLWNLMIGCLLNILLKITFCVYRPWILSSKIHPVPQAIPDAGGYSFPSGHTTKAVALWGSSAFYWKNNKLLILLCTILIALVMFSRNYLGVHTPQDIIVSLLVGLFLLFFVSKILSFIDKNKNRDLYAVLIATFLISIFISYLLLKNYPCHYLNGEILYDTYSMKVGSLAYDSLILGGFWGWFLERRFVSFVSENGSLFNKVLRFVFGIVALFFLDIFAKNVVLFNNELLTCAIIYFVMGMFITFIYPLIFSRFCKK